MATLAPSRSLKEKALKSFRRLSWGDSHGDKGHPSASASTGTIIPPKPTSRTSFLLAIDEGDTVIIVQLDERPFCCHDELRDMEWDQLFEVARDLNRKLPPPLKIPIYSFETTIELLNCLEDLLGFTITRRQIQVDEGSNVLEEILKHVSPPSSPPQRFPPSSRFDMLPSSSPASGRTLDVVFEDEGEGSYCGSKRSKRSRTSSLGSLPPTPTKRHHSMSVHGPAKDLYESQPTHDSGVTASLDGEVKAFMENLPDSVRSLDATLDPDAPIKFSNPKTKTRRSLPFSAANFWKRLG